MQQSDIININKELKDLYLAKKYKEYRSLLVKSKNEITPAQFYFNLGTIDIKLKNYGYARYHLENSIMKGRVSADSYHNLKVVKQFISSKTLGLRAKIVYQSKVLPSDIWLIFTIIITIFLAYMIKFKNLKEKFIIFLIVVLSLLPIGYKYLFLDKQNVAIALTKIDLQEGPTKLFQKIGEIPVGQKLLLEKNNGRWWLIVEPEQYSGWINGNNLGFL